MQEYFGVRVELDLDLDRALHYAAMHIRTSGRNPKPVLLHSSKVALSLYGLGYSREIVLAAALHDLIEDTDIEKADIEIEYGPTIADIVEAASFNPEIEDDLDRARDMFDRCIASGTSALIVKCADLLDNIGYVHLAPQNDQDRLLSKYMLFLDMSSPYIADEPVYRQLEIAVGENFN